MELKICLAMSSCTGAESAIIPSPEVELLLDSKAAMYPCLRCSMWQDKGPSLSISSEASANFAVVPSQEVAELLVISKAAIRNCIRSSLTRINCRGSQKDVVEEDFPAEVDEVVEGWIS